jgi:hypothetical protein
MRLLAANQQRGNPTKSLQTSNDAWCSAIALPVSKWLLRLGIVVPAFLLS